jgi:hypothetical protein
MSTFTGLRDTDMYLLSQMDDPFVLSQLYQTDEYIHNLLNSPSIINRLTNIYSLPPSTSFSEFLDKYVEKMVNNLTYKELHNWMDARAVAEDNALILSLILYHIYNVQVLSKMTKGYENQPGHSIHGNIYDFKERIKSLANRCIYKKRYLCLDAILDFMIRFDLLDKDNFSSMVWEAAELDDYVALNIILPDNLNLFTPENFYKIIKDSLWMSLARGNLPMFGYLINHPASPKKHTDIDFISMALLKKDPKMIVKTIETYDVNQRGEIEEETYNVLYDQMEQLNEDVGLYVKNFLNQFNIV